MTPVPQGVEAREQVVGWENLERKQLLSKSATGLLIIRSSKQSFTSTWSKTRRAEHKNTVQGGDPNFLEHSGKPKVTSGCVERPHH